MLIIGSTAIKNFFPDFYREPKDLDYFHEEQKFSGDQFFHPDLLLWSSWGFRIKDSKNYYAYPDELYTLKISHSYWELPNGSWEKHLNDAMFLKAKGARMIPELHSILYKIWEEIHGKKRVDLNMDSADFFTDAVRRLYDHDSLHESVAYGDRPLYEATLREGSEVAVDMAKVKALPFESQIRLFREEVFATALERVVVPRDYRVSRLYAYHWALRRTITSLTKGWSAQFMAENYDTFRTLDCDYVQRHKDKSHLLRPHVGKVMV